MVTKKLQNVSQTPVSHLILSFVSRKYKDEKGEINNLIGELEQENVQLRAQLNTHAEKIGKSDVKSKHIKAQIEAAVTAVRCHQTA